MWFCPQNSFREILGARVDSRLLIWNHYLLDTVQRRGVITPLLWTLGAGTGCPEEGGKRGVIRENCSPMPFLQLTPLIPLSSGHSVPALTVQRRGVITPLLWTLSGTKTSKSADFQNVPFSMCGTRMNSISRCLHWRFRGDWSLPLSSGHSVPAMNVQEREGLWTFFFFWTLPGIKSQIPFKMLLLAVPVLKSRARGQIEALPKRVPKRLSPLNSLQALPCNSPDLAKNTSDKLREVGASNYIHELKNDFPPTHHPKIVPLHCPQTSDFNESGHHCHPNLPKKFPSKSSQQITPKTSFPKDSQIFQTPSHNSCPKKFPKYFGGCHQIIRYACLDAISPRRHPRYFSTQTSAIPSASIPP